jgi:hypothetical protein
VSRNAQESWRFLGTFITLYGWRAFFREFGPTLVRVFFSVVVPCGLVIWMIAQSMNWRPVTDLPPDAPAGMKCWMRGISTVCITPGPPAAPPE